MAELAALILGPSPCNSVQITNKHESPSIQSPLQNVVKLSYLTTQVFVPMHGSVFVMGDLASVLQKSLAIANIILIYIYIYVYKCHMAVWA